MLPHAFTALQLAMSADAFPTEDYAAQLNPNLSAARRLGRAEVIAKFTMPFTSYSQQLGVSTTVLKRVCAKHGIHKWPYRQVRGGPRRRSARRRRGITWRVLGARAAQGDRQARGAPLP